MKKERQNRILLPHGNGRKLAELFQVTENHVSHVLAGDKHSELSQKIRYLAIRDFGGVEVPRTGDDNNKFNHKNK